MPGHELKPRAKDMTYDLEGISYSVLSVKARYL